MNGREQDLEGLTDHALDASLSPEQTSALRDCLNNNPAAVAEYLQQVRMHALLQWRSGAVGPALPRVEEPKRLKLPADRRWTRWAIAAALVVATALGVVMMSRPAKQIPGQSSKQIAVTLPAVLEVTEVRDVVWSKGQLPLLARDQLKTGAVSIDSGVLVLKSLAGTTVTLDGKASIVVVSDMRLKLTRGQATVRVSPLQHGFTVDAPGADVIDLGTEFGVHVGDAGRTDVVVFEGKIDLMRKSGASGDTLPTRLTQGEGLRVDAAGTAARIVSIEGEVGRSDWSINGEESRSGLIKAVHDNLRDSANPKFYRIVPHGLTEDAKAYVDRSYEWNGVTHAGMPRELVGADLVMTFNSDKHTTGLEVTVSLVQPAILYVFMQANATPPQWLSRDFTDTGLQIGLDEGPPDMPHLQLGKGPSDSIDRVFRVWRQEVTQAGSVTLGENALVKSMYGIAAVPLR